MSDVLRPASLFTAAVPATATSGIQGTLPNPPPEVSQLPAGTTLRGTVLEHDSKGHLLVRTDLGTLAVATKAHLPPGTEVVLQIRSSGAQLHVLLMHSDAQAGGTAQRSGLPAPNPAGSTIPASHSTGTPPPDQLTLGQTVRAVLQASAALPATTGSVSLASGGALDPATAAAVARLPPGSQIVLHILAVDVPPGTSRGAPPGTAPAAAPASAAQPISPGAIPGTIAGQGLTAPSQVPGPASALPVASPVATQTGLPGVNQPGASLTGVPGVAGPPSASGSVPLGAPGQAPSPGGGAPAPGPTASTPTPSTGATSAQIPAGTPPGAGTPLPPPGSAPVAPPNGIGAAYGAAAQTAPLHGGTPPGAHNAAMAGAAGPSGPSPNSTTSPAGSQITGVVTATTNSGHPVLQTPIGTLTLEVQASIPVGSRVVFELSPGALPREMANLPASLARAWPEIQEVVRVLHEATPPGAAAAPGATEILQPGSRLASGLIFFLAALNGGDMGRWLGGQAIQTLKNAGRDNLLARLSQDFGQLSRHVESGGTDWRLFLIPLHDGSQVQQIRFFERHRSHGRGTGDDQQDSESTRFILEIELSRLGDMQIDGLVRGKRFDLMLRTHRPLPGTMRHDITAIFDEANEAAGFAGNIGFQASRDWRFMAIDGNGTGDARSGLVI